jgi:hypothetical protein
MGVIRWVVWGRILDVLRQCQVGFNQLCILDGWRDGCFGMNNND